jgi:hypothetical protein
MSIYTLSYHSRNRLADLNLQPVGELKNILGVAKARNAEAGVTGALLFNEERFVQILEGEKAEVEAIFGSIKRDRRHSAVTVLATQEKPIRHFGAWSMAFVGRSPQARAYYWYFTHRKGFEWARMDNDTLSQLMLEMMNLDNASFLQG